MHYRNYKSLVAASVYLVGASNNSDEGDLHLEQGEHSFPFSFALPTELPASFQGTFGSVKWVSSLRDSGFANASGKNF